MVKMVKRVLAIAMVATLSIGSIQFAPTGVAVAKKKNAVIYEGAKATAFKSAKLSEKLRKEAESLPSKFDLRDVNGKNYVTQVKVQNPWGTCWSFGAIAAVESSILYETKTSDEEYKKKNGKELNLSEKALAWYAFQPITKEDVCDSIPSSQVGEGISTELIQDMNAGYKPGGFAFYVAPLFSAGMGPKDESLQCKGEEDEYPYAYKGKNGWTNKDLYVDEKEEVKAADKEKYVYRTGSEEGYDEFFKKEKETLTKPYRPGWYTDADDWSLPNNKKYRSENNFATIEESYSLPETEQGTSQAGIDAIKKELYNGRAVSILYYADTSLPGQEETKDGMLNTETWAQYTCDESLAPSHCVAIVGYDDTYSKENFLEGKRPEKDGAFIVKNSWGSLNSDEHNQKNWGINDSRYFYLSYYDKSIQNPASYNFYTKDNKLVNEKSIINQYDFMPTFKVMSANIPVESSMANVFTAEKDQMLESISTQSASPGTEVSYEVYLLNKNAENPRDGKLLVKGSKTFEYGGYHRITLDKQYALAKGTRFSVVMTQAVPDDSSETGKSYEILQNNFQVEQEESDGHSTFSTLYKGVLNRDESFLYSSGGWQDFRDVADEQIAEAKEAGANIGFDNFAIKAYSVPVSSNTIKITYNGKTKNVTTKAASFKIAKKKVNKKAQSFTVSRKGKGKISISKKSSKKLNKYIALKSNKVVLKKKAPKGKYKFTITVAGNSGYKKTTSKVVTIGVS